MRFDRTEKDPWKDYVIREHDLGMGLKPVVMDVLFDRVVYEVGPISHLNAGMMSTDISLLMGLADRYEECSYFEIGRRRSESLINLSRVAARCFALNRPAGETRRKGLRHKYMFMMGQYSPLKDNVTLLIGDPRTFDFSVLGQKFDLIFINSGHGYERVLQDTYRAFEFLAHDSSTIVWHDYSYFPEEVNFEVLAGILDGTPPDEREQLSFVSRTKCAILTRDKKEEVGTR